MSISIEFEGLDEMVKKISECCTEEEIQRTNKKILDTCAKETTKKLQQRIPKSKNLTKSGPQHKGSKRNIPGQHSRDSIPVNPIRNKGFWSGIMVGWSKGDNEENFYTKFEEYGTSKIKPLGFMEKTANELSKRYNEIALEEYEKLFKNLE